jgi:hypothetical protein
MISFTKFNEILKEKKEFTIELNFVVQDIKTPFHEVYKFTLDNDNNITSYENNREKHITNSIPHMYFMYRKIFKYTRKKNIFSNINTPWRFKSK